MVNINVKVVFGGGLFTSSSNLGTAEKVKAVLKALEEEDFKVIDTARFYGESEQLLGQNNAASRFIIDTKYPGGIVQGEATKETVIASGEESLKNLKTDSISTRRYVDIYYIHAPDRKNPLEGILAGINELHKAGKFKRFGLSNFTADEVEEVIRVARANSFVLPSVYQGNYNAVARRAETELFPTLRKHNIAFYAYSPIAGGFLTKGPEELAQGGQGRWDPASFIGQLYNSMYKKPAMLRGLEQWGNIAKGAGISKEELAYRWVAFNSHIDGELGDGIVIGARNVEQLKGTLGGIRKGPLSEEVAGKIEEVWKMVEHESPLDNSEGFMSLMQK